MSDLAIFGIVLVGYFIGMFITISFIKYFEIINSYDEMEQTLATMFWPVAWIVFVILCIARFLDKGSDMFVTSLREVRRGKRD